MFFTGAKNSGMLIVAVASSEDGDMVRVRPVQPKTGFRCRSPTTQSAPVPTGRQMMENEVKRRGGKSTSDPQGLNSGLKPTGVTFASKMMLNASSISGSEYTTASDTEYDASQITVTADIETNDDFLDGNDSDDEATSSDSIPDMDYDEIEID